MWGLKMFVKHFLTIGFNKTIFFNVMLCQSMFCSHRTFYSRRPTLFWSISTQLFCFAMQWSIRNPSHSINKFTLLVIHSIYIAALFNVIFLWNTNTKFSNITIYHSCKISIDTLEANSLRKKSSPRAETLSHTKNKVLLPSWLDIRVFR